jgi:hypothetical protein
MRTSFIPTKILLFAALALSSIQLSAQSSFNANKTEDKAMRAFVKRDYEKSLALFIQLDTLSPDPVAWYDYWIGMCLLSSENKLSAIPYLENAKKGGKTSFVIDYYLGRAYLLAGRVEEAKYYLTAYANEFAARGIKFEHKEVAVNEAHRIHVEKSLKDVYGYLAECDTKLNGEGFSDITTR